MKHKKLCRGLVAPLFGVAALALATIQPAQAGFVDYVIRGTPIINHNPTTTEFVIIAPGSKAALGSNDVNGRTLGSIANLGIDRLDDNTRFPTGSGAWGAPYLNFWITDGAGHFAVVANAFLPAYANGYDLSFADLSGGAAAIYETADKSWLPNNGVGITFGDLANFEILAPTVAQLTTGWAGLGTGAPRELGTNMAYGVNWVFGDTLSNYVSGQPGYLVADARVAAVPEPSALAAFLVGLVGLGFMRRRRVS